MIPEALEGPRFPPRFLSVLVCAPALRNLAETAWAFLGFGSLRMVLVQDLLVRVSIRVRDVVLFTGRGNTSRISHF